MREIYEITFLDADDKDYGIVWSYAFRDPELSATAKVVYGYLKATINIPEYRYPSIQTISNELGITVDKLEKYLQELSNYGLIKLVGSRDKNDT